MDGNVVNNKIPVWEDYAPLYRYSKCRYIGPKNTGRSGREKVARAGLPQGDFAGVLVLVDGENGLETQRLGMLRKYPRLLYLGPAHEVRELPPENAVWVPFASTSFAQRHAGALEALLQPRPRPDLDLRRGAAYMAYTCHGHREEFFRALRARLRVDALSLCRGRVAGALEDSYPREEQTLERRLENAVESLADADFSLNISRYSSSWMDDAVERYRRYRFVVAFENAADDGYVTEKIVSAFLAGAVPIYWGTPQVKELFNPAAFLFAGDFRTLDALAAEVAAIDADPARLEAMATAPAVSPAQFDRFFSWDGGRLAADLVARSWQLMKPDQLTDFKWTELWAMARSPAEPMF